MKNVLYLLFDGKTQLSKQGQCEKYPFPGDKFTLDGVKVEVVDFASDENPVVALDCQTICPEAQNELLTSKGWKVGY